MEILYLFLGVVLGGVIVYLWKHSEKALIQQKFTHASEENASLQAQMATLTREKTDLQQLVTSLKVSEGQLSSQLEDEKRRNADDSLRREQQFQDQLKTEREHNNSEHELREKQFQEQLKAEREHNNSENQLRERKFQEQLNALQEKFTNLAQSILDATSSKLKSTNVESMDAITQPLKQKVEELQKAIQTTNDASRASTSSLSEQIKGMMEQTRRIDQTATRLQNVMQGGNKIQGNWGELTLKNLLLAQGMKEGVDFDLQVTVSREDTDSYRPDAVLHYPSGEDVFIDAKMSIDAYKGYVETSDETTKKMYERKVVESVKGQYKNLRGKDYSRFVSEGRTAVDFVIMYVPYEGALQLAFKNDPNLWNEAFNNKVFITSQENLMAVLKVIDIAWRQYKQQENEKRVFILAEALLHRVGAFLNEYEKMKKNLASFTKSFDGLETKISGRQGIIQKANQMKELGVKEDVKYPIPLTDEAEQVEAIEAD